VPWASGSSRWLSGARDHGLAKVEAATEPETVEKAAVEFKQYAPKLMAVRRGVVAGFVIRGPPPGPPPKNFRKFRVKGC
jgi:hypothetical protein